MKTVKIMLHGVGKRVVQQYQIVTEVSHHQFLQNTKAGFSVVTWTGSGADASVGHGLGKKPHVIFVKNRSAGDNWRVWFKDVTTSDAHALVLNDTTGVYTGSDKWYNSPNSNDTTTTTFGVSNDGSTNRSGESFVGYC